MNMKTLFFGYFLMAVFQANGQQSLSLSIFNNATQLPLTSFSAVWKQPLHPGICAGYEFHRREGSPWFQSLKIGIYHHQFVQFGIQIYADVGYRKALGQGFFVDACASLGYLHAIPLTAQAKLTGDGRTLTQRQLSRSNKEQAAFSFYILSNLAAISFCSGLCSTAAKWIGACRCQNCDRKKKQNPVR